MPARHVPNWGAPREVEWGTLSKEMLPGCWGCRNTTGWGSGTCINASMAFSKAIVPDGTGSGRLFSLPRPPLCSPPATRTRPLSPALEKRAALRAGPRGPHWAQLSLAQSLAQDREEGQSAERPALRGTLGRPGEEAGPPSSGCERDGR